MINIENKIDCCGCAACFNVCPKECISLLQDIEGFLYPKIEEDRCIKCKKCIEVCPVINFKKHITFQEKAYLIQNKNEMILRESTSGGAYTAIAEYVIENGGVVYGVAFDNNFHVKHIAVNNKQELYKFRNSKYVQSDVGKSYRLVKRDLCAGKLVCFSGTPCQIEGLINYLNEMVYPNLILIDVVCRAVPSPGVWRYYINWYISRYGALSSVRFRDKTLGYQYSTMEIRTQDGKCDREGIESQPWLRMFFSGMIIRPSCTDCKFRTPYRKSDFTIWDCFASYKIDKSIDEDIGTTRMLIHTEKGKKIFEIIKSKYNYKEITFKQAISGVNEFFNSPKENYSKKNFYSDSLSMSIDELIRKYFPITAKVKFKRNIRRILNRTGLDKIVKRILRK